MRNAILISILVAFTTTIASLALVFSLRDNLPIKILDGFPVINITGARWGIGDNQWSAIAVVQRKCGHETTCSGEASNAYFGHDPAPQVPGKKARITWNCVLPTGVVSRGDTGELNEGQPFNIDCFPK